MFRPTASKCCHSLALGDKLAAMPYYLRHIAAAAAVLGLATGAAGQSFDSVGTRAAGMAGAFVAVTDDASAVYWNPAALASGNFFSIVVDRTSSKTDPAVPQGAAERSGFLFAMGIPALGLSYYQVRLASVSNAGVEVGTTQNVQTGQKAGIASEILQAATGRSDEVNQVRLDTLVTHHTGVTVLHTLGAGITVGTTVKVVHGVASSVVVPDGSRERLLDEAGELGGKGTSRVDADIGVMKAASVFKAGLTIRNVSDPEFETPNGTTLKLQRQARAGVALLMRQGWVLDADLDLTETSRVLGPFREFALGTEGRLGHKIFVRGGFHTNTRDGSQKGLAAGGSYMIVNSLLVDAQVTGGDETAPRGWGISARFVY